MVFQPRLAKLIGVNEAIILNQIHYWLDKKKNIINGIPWVYNSYKDWQQQICFLSVCTIKKVIRKLEALGIVKSGNFNKSKIDKTKWYTIDYELLHNLYEEGKNKPELEKESSEEYESGNTISENGSRNEKDTRIDTKEPRSGLNISMEEVNSNQPIPETNSKTTAEDNEEEKDKPRGLGKVIDFYSKNFRLPSGYELERIKSLWDEIKDSELIILALKQSIEGNARNLRYVEKVLYNWLDRGIKTKEEAEKLIIDYKKYREGRKDERYKGFNGEYRGYNSKASSKDKGKWAGYKAPEPKISYWGQLEGII